MTVANGHDFRRSGGFWCKRSPRIELWQIFLYGGKTFAWKPVVWHISDESCLIINGSCRYWRGIVLGSKWKVAFFLSLPWRPFSSDFNQIWRSRWYTWCYHRYQVWCLSVDWCGSCGVIKFDLSGLKHTWPITTCFALLCKHVIKSTIITVNTYKWQSPSLVVVIGVTALKKQISVRGGGLGKWASTPIDVRVDPGFIISYNTIVCLPLTPTSGNAAGELRAQRTSALSSIAVYSQHSWNDRVRGN
jgi:hypothetical protein